MTALVIGLIVLAVAWAVLASKIREARLDNINAYSDRRDAFNDNSNDIVSDTGGFEQEVVGESHYQADIKAIASRLPENGRFVQAALCLEDGNEHDKNAVAVKIAGIKVGYLPKDAARAYRKMVKKNNHPREAKCPAMISGGDDGKYFGVWLGIDEID